eukprot:COSAG01_NODE_11412_length_1940_cov_1.611081_2_plen_259_part_00
MPENIQVFCRFRRESDGERAERLAQPPPTHADGPCSFADDGCSVSLRLPLTDSVLETSFTFSRVFQPHCTQGELYEETALPLVDGMLQGLNATVLAYGQTGAGKTFTMTGPTDDPAGADIRGGAADLADGGDVQAGIMPRLIGDLFHRLESAEGTCTVSASFVELYNERCRDLLRPTTPGGGRGLRHTNSLGGGTRLNLSGGGHSGGLLVEDATQVPVSSREEVMRVLWQGTAVTTPAGHGLIRIATSIDCAFEHFDC